jgi:hypothetical protein
LRLKVRIWRTRSRAAAGLLDLLQAFHGGGIATAVGLGQFHVAEDGAHDVVEVVGNAAGHGAQGLHLVRLAQLVFKFVALGLGLLAAGEVAREHGGGLAAAVVFEGDADLHGDLASAGRARRHLAQHGLRGQRREGQGLGRIGQETLQRAAQRVVRRAQEQGGGRRVEDGDALVLVQADDGVQRGIDDRLQPPLAEEQLVVALLQRQALGQQRPWSTTAHRYWQWAGRFAGGWRCRPRAGRHAAGAVR